MRKGEIPGGALKRLFKIIPQTGCWEWTAGTTGAGYPRKQWFGVEYSARRWIWLLLVSPIPKDKIVDVTCGNRLCVCPAHLKLTTMTIAQRAGETTTLVQADVDTIRESLRSPWAAKSSWRHNTAVDLALEYGVHPGTIKSIWGNHSWKIPSVKKGITAMIAHHQPKPSPSHQSQPQTSATASTHMHSAS